MVELLSVSGNDTTFVDVARVSYNKKADNYTEEQNIKLINYLVKHGHTSVFRHATLSFRVTCPIYVERQLFKHSVGISVNSISGRYVDFSDTYYEIEQFRKQSTDSKQGSAEDIDLLSNVLALVIQKDVIKYCKDSYDALLRLGISKEQARSVLPLSLNTTFIWTGTFLAFIHMCNLRLKPDAQKETRDIVQLMLDAVKSLEDNPFQHSLKAFNY